MKAKKFSFHAVLLCIAALFVTLLLLLSSCEESGAGSTGKPDHGKTHIHTFSAEWSSNDTHHWHAASCEHTNEVSDKAGHTFGDWITDQEATEETAGAKHHVCTVCGKTENAEIPKLPHTHKFSNDWSGDDIYHWHAASCEHTNIVSDMGKHVFGADDICNICGKAKPIDERTFAYTVENGQATLISYTPLGKISPTLIIPSTLGGYPVVRISEVAFSNLKNIKEIVLPDSIIAIVKNAFKDCSDLSSITLGNGVINIGSSAFSGCTRLTSITIPDGVTNIGDSAFYHCTSLTSITIPDSVTSIGSYAFEGCSRLTSITIPDSVTSIGYQAFMNCTSLTSITIPDGVTNIGDSAFSGCTNLQFNAYDNALYLGNAENPYLVLVKAKSQSITSCVVSEKAKVICGCAFSGCTRLSSVTIPDGVTRIDYRAFYGCTNLKNIYITDMAAWCKLSGLYNLMNYGTDNKNLYLNNELITNLVIPNGVTSIGSYAFMNCTSLTSITIPDSVSNISQAAFSGCTGLTNITIPDGVTSIDSDTFEGTNLQFNAYDNALYLGNAENPYLVLVKAKNKSITSCVVSEKAKVICGFAFYDCTELTSITIQDSVTSIGSYAFGGCTGLTSITIPDSVTSIGSYAFFGCTNLKNIYITDMAAWCKLSGLYNLMNYGTDNKNLYLNNELITNLVIPNGVTSIGSYAFMNCTSLTSITIPDSVSNISQAAFSGCTGLTNITIPDGVTSIDSDTFEGTNLQFNAYDNALYLGNAENPYLVLVKAKSQSITSCVISEKAKIICECAFSGCTRLSSVTIPDGVTSIGGSAFRNCTELTSITIPDSVTSIGSSSVFDGTSLQFNAYDNALYLGNAENPYLVLVKAKNQSITSCVISEKTKVICNYAFSGCTRLTSITIPDSVTNIGSSAFSGCTGLTSITIPDSVTSIGSYAFLSCTGLTSITIPDSVTSIGESAFYNCTSLKIIYYTGTAAQWAKISKGSNIPNDITIVYNYKPTA